MIATVSMGSLKGSPSKILNSFIEENLVLILSNSIPQAVYIPPNSILTDKLRNSKVPFAGAFSVNKVSLVVRELAGSDAGEPCYVDVEGDEFGLICSPSILKSIRAESLQFGGAL